MIDAVSRGRDNTAMMAFANILTASEIEAVVDFIRDEFMQNRRMNTRYHSAENGWPNHERYAIAYPFALGEIPIDTPWGALTDEQQRGKQIFLSTCISCHDRSRVRDQGAIWESRPLSYPRNGYSHRNPEVDTESGATPYRIHELAPHVPELTAEEKIGEKLFQQNCAFCHAPDGTGKNWIGSFLDSHPRDLTGARVATLSEQQLAETIRNGIKGTTMSAWKSVLTDQQIHSIVAYVRRVFVDHAETSASNKRTSE